LAVIEQEKIRILEEARLLREQAELKKLKDDLELEKEKRRLQDADRAAQRRCVILFCFAGKNALVNPFSHRFKLDLNTRLYGKVLAGAVPML